MILTYKIKHTFNLATEFAQAFQIAKFGVQHRVISSKEVKHFGLKSMLANQILRKYARNRKTHTVKRVNLTVPNQGIKCNQEQRTIRIPCLKLVFNYNFRNDFTKIHQIEISEHYVYVSAAFPEQLVSQPSHAVGVDLNATGHLAVAADPSRGKVLKLGKSGSHIRRSYKSLRRRFQKRSKFKKLKTINRRESRRVRDLNHKISRKVVQYAKDSNALIKLEKLTHIRRRTRRGTPTSKGTRCAVNNWSFYQLQQFIEYKAKLLGVVVVYVGPQYTSQECSRCGLLGNRNGKTFKCPHCGHVDHADANAAFNIADRVSRDHCCGV